MNPQILALQSKLQAESYGYNVEELDEDKLIEYVRWNVIALEHELHEALDEISWKPWASARYVNRMELLKELIDVAHFFNNIWLSVCGLDPEKSSQLFEQLYEEKHKVNAERQVVGYDGVSGKCKFCGRDLATTAKTATTRDNEIVTYCLCGRVLGVTR